ncbi:MAG: UvrB/UvrC motif-containing protein [Clostridiales bacterium]|jgi:protein arginine kinase activator|nr:UvrB/UvrC motif-containing protein [Clostridiales bacterium]
MIDDPIKNFLQYVFEMVEGMERMSAGADFQTCAECGTTYGGFKKTGKMGCANCYMAFRANIAGALRNIHHGAVKHTGKVPRGNDGMYSDVLAKRELEENRRLLRAAVEAEAFEDAARYRDIVNSLQERIGE